MAQWIECTRASDNTPVRINLDTVSWMRRNEEEGFTVISFKAPWKDNSIRVLEQPEEILANPRGNTTLKNKAIEKGEANM